MLENTRVFAKDGRYYRYASGSKEFEMILSKCGFQTEYILQKTVKENTYNEPFLETTWANYYVQKASRGLAPNTIDLAMKLTSEAYEKCVDDFVKVYLTNKKNNNRKATITKLLDKLKAYLNNTDTLRVLDAGCGPGDYVIEMATREWNAVGIDLSEKMIKFARSNLSQYSKEVQNRVDFIYGKMQNLPDSWTESFDAIICITAFQHIPIEQGNMLNVLKGFAKVLKPGGVLRIDIQLERETGFGPDLRFIQGVENPNQITNILEEAGFEQLDCRKWTLPSKRNSYQRPIVLKFANFWARKKG